MPILPFKFLYKPKSKAVPKNAHGKRYYDNGYFSIWVCQEGHCTIGECDSEPTDETCRTCQTERIFGKSKADIPKPTWTLATPAQVHEFIYGLEGSLTAPGFTLLV